MMGTDRWLTLDELAGYLKLSRSKLYRMAQDGDVPASKAVPQWCFGRHEIDQCMKSQGLGADDSLGDEVLMDRVGFLLARKADGQVI